MLPHIHQASRVSIHASYEMRLCMKYHLLCCYRFQSTHHTRCNWAGGARVTMGIRVSIHASHKMRRGAECFVSTPLNVSIHASHKMRRGGIQGEFNQTIHEVFQSTHHTRCDICKHSCLNYIKMFQSTHHTRCDERVGGATKKEAVSIHASHKMRRTPITMSLM